MIGKYIQDIKDTIMEATQIISVIEAAFTAYQELKSDGTIAAIEAALAKPSVQDFIAKVKALNLKV